MTTISIASLAASLAVTALLAQGCASSKRFAMPDIDPALHTLAASGTSQSASVINNPADYRLQVMLSDVVPGDAGRPGLRRSGFRVDQEYFYPASTIKLAGAIVAAQLAEELDEQRHAPGPGAWQRTLNTPLAFHPLFDGQSLREVDPSNLAVVGNPTPGAVTLSHEIRKLFLVSDNAAYNRLYEFVGQEELNRRVWSMGLSSARLSHRLSEGRTTEQNRLSPMIELRYTEGTRTLPARRSTLDLVSSERDITGLIVGTGFKRADATIAPPMNFAALSRISLVDLQDMLVMLVKPSIDLGKPGFTLSGEARHTLTSVMSEYPSESSNPAYPISEYPDDYGKFLLPGLLRVAPHDQWTIINKVGQAYGFTIDNAYIQHRPSGKSLFITAVLYTNADGILNDDAYEYEQIAFPFFADLGQLVGERLVNSR